jgi:hypothetical protein
MNCMKSYFELIHIDVHGIFTITSLLKVQYILTFTDDYNSFG